MIYLYLFAGFLVIVFLFYKWLDFKFYFIFSGTKKGVSTTPEDFKVFYEPIYFKSLDGIDLSGWFIQSQNESEITMIIAHGYGQNKSDMLEETIDFNQCLNLFYIDFRGYGESKGNFTSYGLYESKDIIGAINFLKNFREDFSKKIYIYASSFASVSVSQLNEDENINMVILNKPVIDLKEFIKNTAGKMSLWFVSDFFIKKYLKCKRLDLEFRRFKFPVVFLTDGSDIKLFDLIDSAQKDKIEKDARGLWKGKLLEKIIP